MRNHVIFLCMLAITATLGIGASPASADVIGHTIARRSLADGVWGARITVGGRNYLLGLRFFDSGKVVWLAARNGRTVAKHAGSYRGGRIVVRLPHGKVGTWRYQLNGDRLLLVNRKGTRIMYSRIRKQRRAVAHKPAPTLNGTWTLRAKGGRIVARFGGGRMTLVATNSHGRIVSRLVGRYAVRGNRIVVRLDDGRQAIFGFARNGNRLTLIVKGHRYTFARSATV